MDGLNAKVSNGTINGVTACCDKNLVIMNTIYNVHLPHDQPGNIVRKGTSLTI